MTNRASMILMAACSALAACGGGSGGGGSGIQSTPPPAPPPGPALPLAKIGTSQVMPTYGYLVTFDTAADGTTSSAVSTTEQVELRYDSSADKIFARVLDGPEITLKRHNSGWTADPSVSPYAGFYWTSTGNLYSAVGSSFTRQGDSSAPPYQSRFSDFVTGLATPADQIPTSGSASYTAELRGSTDPVSWAHADPADPSSPAESSPMRITGSATFGFDFASGTLSGSIMPAAIRTITYTCVWECDSVYYALGTYSFANSLFGAGNQKFSGQFNLPSGGIGGAFRGQFYGPGAVELGGNFRAPFKTGPGEPDYGMAGIFIGSNRAP